MSTAARTAPESAALAALVREQRDALVRSIVAVTGLSKDDAEDVLSIVTLRVLLNGVTTEPESWFSYMREAARNEASNARRGQRRRAYRESAASLPVTADPHVDAIAARVVWLDVMEAVDQLPALERDVVRLHYFHDLSYDEVASSLGLTRAGVDKRMRQARRRLRSSMAERETDAAYGHMLALLGASLGSLTTIGRRAATLAPPAAAVAGVVALSVFAVVAVPLPRLGGAGGPLFAVDVADSPGSVSTVGHRAPEPRRDTGYAPPHGTSVWPLPTADGDSSGSPLDGVTPVRPSASACAGETCVGAHEDLPGDRVTLTRVPAVPVMQNVTPVCWLVPDNPEVTCASDDPEAYTVPRPTGPPQPEQDSGQAAGKSSPAAPDHREPQ